MKKFIAIFCLLMGFAATGKAQLPAFPGAQGGGAASVGGRGGAVIEVTNLFDSGPGSLRACVEASGPRTCIFRVSGVIIPLSRMTVAHPFITIAGQTAPGGIRLSAAAPAGQGGEPLDVQTHDVIARYLSFDGYKAGSGNTGPDTGTVGYEIANGAGDVYNVVFDHLSGRWVGNKYLIYANDETGSQHINRTTWQWCLLYEPNIAHPVGPLMSAVAFPNEDNDNDWHHNMFINTGHRIPLVMDFGRWRMVSNLTFNWDYFAVGQNGSASDFVNNLWVAGNLNNGNSNPHPLNVTLASGTNDGTCLANCDIPTTPSIYMTGNVGPQGTDYQLSAEEAGTDPEGFPETTSPIRTGWRRGSPLSAEAFPIKADAPSTLDAVILPTIGNSGHLDCLGNFVIARDSQDQRVINQYQARASGGEFNGPNYNGPPAGTSIPTPSSALCTETLHDGIPDQYKVAKGLSTTDTNLHNVVAPNGYTWLENYLMGSNTVISGGGGGGTNTTLTITNITVTNITSTSATVNWTTSNPANSTVNYGICNNLLPTPTNPALVTNHSVNLTGLTASTIYTFNVESFDGTTTLTSPNSLFTTLAAPGGGSPGQPAAPMALATSAPTQAFQLQWSPSPTAGVTSYKVYRSATSGTGYVLKAQVTGSPWVDTAVTVGQTLYYVVTAVCPGCTTQESAFSNQIVAVIP